MKIELGSGYDPTPGYVHVDLNPNAPHVDRVASAWPLDWLEDESVEEIRAVDILEHISYRDTLAVLAEWARVLKSGGRLFVQVPDADKIMRSYAAGRMSLAQATTKLLGGHTDGKYARDGDDFRLNAHYALFSVQSLRNAVQAAGLERQKWTVNGHPNIQLTAVKP